MENADTSTRTQNLIDVISKTAVEILPEKQKQVQIDKKGQQMWARKIKHFSKHFNVAPPNNIPDEFLEIPQYIKNLQDAQSADLNHAPPTTEEIKKTLITEKW